MSANAIEKNECLNDIKNSAIHDIFEENDEIDNLYDQFKSDYSQCCDVNSKYRNNCKRTVKQSYYRRLPGIASLVYPWKNYDFNYSNVLNKQINMKAIGASSSGSMSGMLKNTNAATKIFKSAMLSPIPNKGSIANVTDKADCIDPGITVQNDIYNDSIHSSCDARLSTYFGAMVVAMPMIWFGGLFMKIAGGIMAAAAQSAWAEPNFKKCMHSLERGDGTAGDMGEVFSLGLANMTETRCRRPGNLTTSNGLPVVGTQLGNTPYYKCDGRRMTCKEAQQYVRKRVPNQLTKYPKSYQWTNRTMDEPLSAYDKNYGGQSIPDNHGDTSGVNSSDHGGGPYTVDQGGGLGSRIRSTSNKYAKEAARGANNAIKITGQAISSARNKMANDGKGNIKVTSSMGHFDGGEGRVYSNKVYVCTACNNKKESFDKMKAEYTNKCLDWENCNVGNSIRTDMYKDLDKVPYGDAFFNKQLDGKYASSYFIKSGLCYQPEIYTEKDCLAKNPKIKEKIPTDNTPIRGGGSKTLYYWTPNNLKKYKFASKFPASQANMFTKDGNCYRAKYSFIDNAPGIKTRILDKKFTLPVIQGLYPSMAQDMFAMNPLSAISVYLGISTGDFVDMKCAEFFTTINKKSKSKSIRLFNVLIVFLLLIFIYALYRK